MDPAGQRPAAPAADQALPAYPGRGRGDRRGSGRLTLYVDSSALVKAYVEHPDSAEAEAYLASDMLATARHSVVEVRGALTRVLGADDLAEGKEQFARDLVEMAIIELDEPVCDAAADIAELTGVRTLDALHISAAQRLGGTSIPFLTYDRRQAQAARALGFTVLGA